MAAGEATGEVTGAEASGVAVEAVAAGATVSVVATGTDELPVSAFSSALISFFS